MTNMSYTFGWIAEFYRYLMYGLAVAAACGGACWVAGAACRRAGQARQRRRADADLRAEAARGLADIETFLRRPPRRARPPSSPPGNGPPP